MPFEIDSRSFFCYSQVEVIIRLEVREREPFYCLSLAEEDPRNSVHFFVVSQTAVHKSLVRSFSCSSVSLPALHLVSQ